MKKCSKCNIEKEDFEFCKAKRGKNGLAASCKSCDKKYKASRKEHTDKVQAEYRKKNTDKRKAYNADYRKNHIAELKEYHKQYRKTHKAKSTNKCNSKHYAQYESQRKKVDIQFRLRKALRLRLYIATKRNFKSGSAVSDLGCSIEEFKLYLESKFTEGMSWDNWGSGDKKWNIDHIIPLSSVDLTDRNELLRVCHYTNMQPLWHKDNIRKSNKIGDDLSLALV